MREGAEPKARRTSKAPSRASFHRRLTSLTGLLLPQPKGAVHWHRLLTTAADRWSTRNKLAQACNNIAWQMVTGPAQERDLAQALPLAEKALVLRPEEPMYRSTLGVVYYRLERYGPAVEALERSLRETQGDSAGHDLFVLAMCHARRGEAAAAKDVITVSLNGQKIAGTRCGPTCYDASAAVSGGETVRVDVAGAGGGTATFGLPTLPAADGSQLLQMATERMRQLHAFRITETLGPARIPLITDYQLEAPDRLKYMLATGPETVFVGATRYSRDGPTDPWKVESTSPIQVPTLFWEQESSQGPKLAGSDQIDGVQTQIVTFFEVLDGGPIWFRLWVDGQGLVRRAEMRAPGHFMDQHYFDFDGPISISAPV